MAIVPAKVEVFMVQLEIAAVAARMVVEEGLDFAAAKRKAVKDMGLSVRTALPDNDQLQQAVEDYVAEYCADTQPAELRALRELARDWMLRLQAFRPYISGAVWNGSATRTSDVYLQLFCDDSKATEIFLIDQQIRYQPGVVTVGHGKPQNVLHLQVFCAALQEYIGVHLMIYDRDDMRDAPKTDARGRKLRGDVAALNHLLENT
jgi:hypothetical protein